MQEIDARTARKWVEAGEARVVDVREPGEYARGHIPGSLLMPLGGLSAKTLPAEFTGKLILVCASGMRSKRGCGVVQRAGLTPYSLRGGMGAWRKEGGAVQAAPREQSDNGGYLAFLGPRFAALDPVRRHAAIVAGLNLIAGIVLTFVMHPAFLALTAFAVVKLWEALRTPKAPAPSCNDGASDRTSCTTPDAKGKTGGCGGCGAR